MGAIYFSQPQFLHLQIRDSSTPLLQEGIKLNKNDLIFLAP